MTCLHWVRCNHAQSFHVVASEKARRADGRGAIDNPEVVLRLTVETGPLDARVSSGRCYPRARSRAAISFAAALEPDSQNRHAAHRLLPLTGEHTLPRATAELAAPMQVWQDR